MSELKEVQIRIKIPIFVNNYLEGVRATARSLPYVRIENRKEGEKYRDVPSKQDLLIELLLEATQARIAKLSQLQPIE